MNNPVSTLIQAALGSLSWHDYSPRLHPFMCQPFEPRPAEPPEPTPADFARLAAAREKRRRKARPCPCCGQPVLRPGQKRENPDEYQHAAGCPRDDRRTEC